MAEARIRSVEERLASNSPQLIQHAVRSLALQQRDGNDGVLKAYFIEQCLENGNAAAVDAALESIAELVELGVWESGDAIAAVVSAAPHMPVTCHATVVRVLSLLLSPGRAPCTTATMAFEELLRSADTHPMTRCLRLNKASFLPLLTNAALEALSNYVSKTECSSFLFLSSFLSPFVYVLAYSDVVVFDGLLYSACQALALRPVDSTKEIEKRAESVWELLFDACSRSLWADAAAKQGRTGALPDRVRCFRGLSLEVISGRGSQRSAVRLLHLTLSYAYTLQCHGGSSLPLLEVAGQLLEKRYSSHTVSYILPVLVAYIGSRGFESEQRAAIQVLTRWLGSLKYEEKPYHVAASMPFIVPFAVRSNASASAAIRANAAQLLEALRKETTELSDTSLKVDTEITEWWFGPVREFVELVEQARCAMQKCSDAWLRTLCLRFAGGEWNYIEPLSLFVLSPFLFHSQPSVRTQALELVNGLGTRDQISTGSSLLPLLMVRCGQETEPATLVRTFHTLVSVGSHRLFISSTVRAIDELLKRPDSEALGVRLWARLWEHEFRVFTKLQLVMQQSYRSGKAPLGVRVAVAQSVRDVCIRSPVKGLELIGLLSEVISKDSSDAVVGFGVQALRVLCMGPECASGNRDMSDDDGYVDFSTAWNVIRLSIRKDERVIVLVELCKLFQAAAPLVVEYLKEDIEALEKKSAGTDPIDEGEEGMDEDESEEVDEDESGEDDEEEDEEEEDEDEEDLAVMDELLHLLMQWCAHEAIAVRIEALRTLHIFAKKDVEILRPFADVIATRALTDSDQGCIEAGAEILALIVGGELQTMRRTGMSLAATVPGLSAFSKLSAIISEKYEAGEEPALIADYAAALLFDFKPKLPRNVSTERGATLITAAAYRTALNDAVKDVRTDSWEKRLMIVPGWIKFMGEYMEAAIAAEHARALAKDSSCSIVSAVEAVTTKLQDTLLEYVKSTPAVAENALLALSCATASSSQTIRCAASKVLRNLMDLLQEKRNDWVGYASAVGCGIITSALSATDTSLYRDAMELLLSRLRDSEITNVVRGGCAIGLGYVATGEGGTLESVNGISYADHILQAILSVHSGRLHSGLRSDELDWVDVGCAAGMTLGMPSVSNTLVEAAALVVKEHMSQSVGCCIAAPALACELFRRRIVGESEMNEYKTQLFELQGGSSDELCFASMSALSTFYEGAVSVGYPLAAKEIEDLAERYVEVARTGEVERRRAGALVGLANLAGANTVSCVHSSSTSRHLVRLSDAVKCLKPSLLILSSTTPSSHWSGQFTAIVRKVMGAALVRVSDIAIWVAGLVGRPIPEATKSSHVSNLPKSSLFRRLITTLHEFDTSVSKCGDMALLGTVLCLSKCRSILLPDIDWFSILQRIFRSETMGEETLRAVIEFALAHGKKGSISTWLSQLYTKDGMKFLSDPLVSHLIHGLPRAVLSFSDAYCLQLLGTLEDLSSKFLANITSAVSTWYTKCSNAEVQDGIHQFMLRLLDVERPLLECTPERSLVDAVGWNRLLKIMDVLRLFPSQLLRDRLSLQGTTNPKDEVKRIAALSLLCTYGSVPRTTHVECRTWLLSLPVSHMRTAMAMMGVVSLPFRFKLENGEVVQSNYGEDAAAVQAAIVIDWLDAVSMAGVSLVGCSFLAHILYECFSPRISAIICSPCCEASATDKIPYYAVDRREISSQLLGSALGAFHRCHKNERARETIVLRLQAMARKAKTEELAAQIAESIRILQFEK